jgi:RNA polymerase sigma-70 factor (ECF subfamily)
LRVWQQAAEFDLSHGSPFRWLATIARNGALDARPRATLPLSHDLSAALGNEDLGGPQLLCEPQEEATRLFACLAELGTERRAIVITAYFFGMTRRQIAERSGQPPARVKAWLRASLSDLRAALDAAEAKREAAE